MIQEKHIGIVLKSYFPKKCKLALLDNKMGKIAGVPPADRSIPAGSLIEYSLVKQAPCSFLHGVDVHNMPFTLAKQDILFLHHVLEMCYYFIPSGSQNKAVFSLLQILYTSDNWLQVMAVKKFFLLRLFILLGLYPEEQKFKSPSFHRLVQVTFEQMLDEEVKQYDEKALDEWLQECVASHPIADRFKTTYFLHGGGEI